MVKVVMKVAVYKQLMLNSDCQRLYVGTLSLQSRLNEVQYFKWASTVKLGDFPPSYVAVSRWMFHVLSIPRVKGLNGRKY